MRPAEIIREARADGVRLALSPAGTIKATGDEAVVNRWLPEIREHKAEILKALKIGAAYTAPTSRYWRVHFVDRESVESVHYPDASHSEVLAQNPSAIAAEPFDPNTTLAQIPLTKEQEKAILAWLAQIEEDDPEAIAEVVGRCQREADARD